MNAAPVADPAAEINRLHREVQRCSAASRAALDSALRAAWEAGQLLLQHRRTLVAGKVPGAWPLWVEQRFRGSLRTAQRYIQLAQSLADPSFLCGLSLRQAYFRLGIATEPKRTHQHAVAPLPDYVRLASRLICALKRKRRGPRPVTLSAYRRDLRALYDELRPLFADTASAPTVSPSHERRASS